MDPYFLVKGKRRRQLFDTNMKIAEFPNYSLSMTPRAYITNESFIEWAHVFVANLKSLNINGALLIMDSHSSHALNLVALECFNNNNIICIAVPPHSTHLSSPLDVSVFRPFKKWFSTAQNDYRRDVKKILTYDDFPFLIKDAYWKAFIMPNIKSGDLLGVEYVIHQQLIGFEATGIYPLNKNWVSIPENASKLAIQRSFREELPKDEKFELMIKTYNIDDHLQTLSLSGLDLSTQFKKEEENDLIMEIDKDKFFIDAMDKFLSGKEAKFCLNFDHMGIKKRKRDVFEEKNGAKILNTNERLKKLEEYMKAKEDK